MHTRDYLRFKRNCTQESFGCYQFDRATYVEIVALTDEDDANVWFDCADYYVLRFGMPNRPAWNYAGFEDAAELLDFVSTLKEQYPDLPVWYAGPETFGMTRVRAPIWSSMTHLMAAHDEDWEIPRDVVHNSLPMDDPRTVKAISEEPLIATAIDRLEKLKASGVELPRNSGIVQFAFALPASAAS
ncbi:hypothetical protein [Methylobacterium oryzisoli]|uniref:hypothetical protein n=1 Tax=Methylobacterium oryzisoli TaxID=3385502 RepID=UPI003892AF11